MDSQVTDVAIVGAGPYGLSLAAHLERFSLYYRIFGVPMQTWREHMPKGMVLKSNGNASNLADPKDRFTLEAYCKAKGLEYHPMIPPNLDVFVDYALDFQRRLVRSVEEVDVVSIEQLNDDYRLILETGEKVQARRVVLAVGITHFDVLPDTLAKLPPVMVSHSAAHSDPSQWLGKSVAIIGAGASAVELAVLMREAGVDVRLIPRTMEIPFYPGPSVRNRSLWQRIRRPNSGLGNGIKPRLLSDLPDLFRLLPAESRYRIFRRFLGPVSSFHLKERRVGKVPILLSTRIERAEPVGAKARLYLTGALGNPETLDVDHVVAATGYPPMLFRWRFLEPNLVNKIKLDFNSPRLSYHFETSARGLYVIGLGSAMSFGPLCRFVFGARFAARRLSRHFARASERA